LICSAQSIWLGVPVISSCLYRIDLVWPMT
jgi:hypothetical protein